MREVQKLESLKNMRSVRNNKHNLKLETGKIKKVVPCFICAILAICSIFMTIESSTSGSLVAKLQKKESELFTEQQDLQQMLVKTLSVNTLQEQSVELGFTKVTNLVYVNDSVGVASSGQGNSAPVAKLPY